MKRFVSAWSGALLLLLSSPAVAQQAGILLTFHGLTVHLKPGTTMDQFQAFFIHRVLPEYER